MNHHFKTCRQPGCSRPIASLGLCSMHYQRLKRNGDPEAVGTPKGSARQFFEQAAITLDKATCIIWPFSINKYGYPRITVDGQRVAGHSLMCARTHGPKSSPSLHAAHRCGNRACINPHHIRWATPSQNFADSVEHGTALLGEKSTNAKLKAHQVLAICREFGKNSEYRIAQRYGVSTTTIARIRTGRIWSSVTGIRP